MNVIVANRNDDLLKSLNIDVIKSVNGEYDISQLQTMFQNFFFQRLILDVTAIKNYKEIDTIKTLSSAFDVDKVILLLDNECSNPYYISELVSAGIYNFARNVDEINKLLERPNNYSDVKRFQLANTSYNQMAVNEEQTPKKKITVIGFKNITSGAGATTLIYMLKRELQKKYRVLTIEVNKRDFMCFNDNTMISVNDSEINNIVVDDDLDIILIDLNNSSKSFSLCNEVIYLIEPSIVKLHKMMSINPDILNRLNNKKVILNKSLLTDKEVKDFENQSKLQVLFNIPPLNERKNDFPLLEQLIFKLFL